MSFSSFQNDSGQLRRYERDFTGDLSLSESIDVECDVQLESKRIISKDGEEITTSAVVFVSPNSSLLGKAIEVLTGATWKFFYEGTEKSVEVIHRVRRPATDVVDHFELRLR